MRIGARCGGTRAETAAPQRNSPIWLEGGGTSHDRSSKVTVIEVPPQVADPRLLAPDRQEREKCQKTCPDRTNPVDAHRSEEHTSELQSLMRISYAVFCLKKKTKQ